MGPQLTDKRPQFGEQVIKVSETWKRTEKPKLQVGALLGPQFLLPTGGTKHLSFSVDIKCAQKKIIITTRIMITVIANISWVLSRFQMSI